MGGGNRGSIIGKLGLNLSFDQIYRYKKGKEKQTVGMVVGKGPVDDWAQLRQDAWREGQQIEHEGGYLDRQKSGEQMPVPQRRIPVSEIGILPPLILGSLNSCSSSYERDEHQCEDQHCH